MGLSEIIVLNLIIHNLAFQLVKILLFNDSISDRKERLKYDNNVFKKSFSIFFYYLKRLNLVEVLLKNLLIVKDVLYYSINLR